MGVSRSGYNEYGDIDQWDLIRWRGAVKSAIRGRRGQAFLKELLVALDVLPKPELIAHDLIRDGKVCTIGAVGLSRGIDMSDLSPEQSEKIAERFGIADALVREIEFINDEDFCCQSFMEYPDEALGHRFAHVRKWVVDKLKPGD